MKPIFSEQYYRDHWEEFLKRVIGEDYINLEGELERAMKVYVEAGLPFEALQIIEKMEAGKLIARCEAIVKKEAARFSGNASERGLRELSYDPTLQ